MTPATPTLGTQDLSLARRGKTWAEIAADLGVPYHTAYRAAHVKAQALGVAVTLEPLRRGPRPRRPMTCALRAKGLTLPEAAARLGVTPVTLGKWAAGSHRPRARYVAALRELLGDVDLGTPAEPAAPVPVVKPRPGGRKPQPGTKGERAYVLRQDGLSWVAISRDLGLITNSADCAARHYARIRSLPWPPE
jgi:transcriptional regulator with XRE-family HTH domain